LIDGEDAGDLSSSLAYQGFNLSKLRGGSSE
jgi:hypothetical protein